jgi:hypothetical protein
MNAETQKDDELMERSLKKTIPWPEINLDAFTKVFQVIPKKIRIGLAATVIVIIAIAMITLGHDTNHEKSIRVDKPNASLSQNLDTHDNPSQEQINDIISKLANIELAVNTHKGDDQIESITNALKNLEQQTEAIASHNKDDMVDNIDRNTTQLQDQLKKISDELKALKESHTHHTYVDSQYLPFKVISIDNLQENTMVTIHYAHRDIPVMVGDSMAGWTLIDASFSSQKATFTNKASNFVLVNLVSIKHNQQ